ncbi:unnamed protein product [Strongylus vulgaris]|uniref:PLAT domain-containing protein n=1 Tax=Strongylus vulgaris TaxID=40348 RepID=A0A3P7M0R6_STRVU|nr:unnamed protein product [Strongylus vulgaris]
MAKMRIDSEGRWEFILHNGMEDGNGGTTSNLIIIGYGTTGNFYLEWVELRDLDTEERIAVRVGKWMDVTGQHTKKPQAFREISVFRSGDQPLELQNYEGKVFGGDMRLLKDNSLQAQLIGDFSDSGVFPLIYNANKKV